jgi:hypothetical protein
MRRREFITLLGGAAAAWPLVARAQQGERMRRIGVLVSGSEGDPEMQARLAGFHEGLKRFGWSGLIRIGDTSMTQGFAEQWLDWHDARNPNWSQRGVLLALLIAIVGFVGWLLGWR